MKYLKLAVFAVVLPLQALAVSVFISNVKTSDADPELASSVKSLVVSSASSAGASVVETQNSADYLLQPELIKLGGAYVLTVSKIRQGKIIFTSKQKAASAAELDEAADRAVRAALISTPAKKDLRVGEVQEKDKDQIKNRILSKDSTYLGFGIAGFSNMGVTSTDYDFALGYNWETTSHAAIRVLANFVASSDFKTYFLDGLLGLNWYFTDESSSPYVFGGLGFGSAGTTSSSSSATTVGGFDGALGLGYGLFRTSSTQFDMMLDYHLLSANNTIGNPGFYAFRIAVMY